MYQNFKNVPETNKNEIKHKRFFFCDKKTRHIYFVITVINYNFTKIKKS